MGGPVTSDFVDPPAGMLIASDGIFGLKLCHQQMTFAQEAAQDSIDKARAPRLALAHALDGLIDQRVIGVGLWLCGAGPKQGQGGDQHAVHGRWRRFGHQSVADGFGTTGVTQGVKTQGLGPGAQLRWTGLERIGE